MISVSIAINSQPVMARSAINRGEVGNGFTKYELDDGSTVFHKREDGAVKLAIAMLKQIKEPK